MPLIGMLKFGHVTVHFVFRVSYQYRQVLGNTIPTSVEYMWDICDFGCIPPCAQKANLCGVNWKRFDISWMFIRHICFACVAKTMIVNSVEVKNTDTIECQKPMQEIQNMEKTYVNTERVNVVLAQIYMCQPGKDGFPMCVVFKSSLDGFMMNWLT